MSIAELFELRNGKKATLAVTGSGGKTSLIYRLAKHFRAERVLVGTSVKMFTPQPGDCDFLPEVDELDPATDMPAGITFVGIRLDAQGKIGALPPGLLEALMPRFDKVLIEADGSRRRPYKGWADTEPVLPEGVDITVAVIPVPPPGLMVSEESIHRLPLFLEISGARPGEALRPEHLAAAIAHPRGLLAKTRGRTILFFNQADDVVALERAKNIAAMLPPACTKRLWRIIAGSVQGDSGLIIQ